MTTRSHQNRAMHQRPNSLAMPASPLNHAAPAFFQLIYLLPNALRDDPDHQSEHQHAPDSDRERDQPNKHALRVSVRPWICYVRPGHPHRRCDILAGADA